MNTIKSCIKEEREIKLVEYKKMYRVLDTHNIDTNFVYYISKEKALEVYENKSQEVLNESKVQAN